jgi:hypothetical protein
MSRSVRVTLCPDSEGRRHDNNGKDQQTPEHGYESFSGVEIKSNVGVVAVALQAVSSRASSLPRTPRVHYPTI